MGCFLACFGDSKRRKPRKSPVEIPPANHGFKASEGVRALEEAKEVVEVPSIEINTASIEKSEEQIELCRTTENTFPIIEDDKVVLTMEVEKTYPIIEDDKVVPTMEVEKTDPISEDDKVILTMEVEKTYPISEDDKVVLTMEENHLDGIKKEEKKSGREDDELKGNSNLSTACPLPLNHRYKDCPISDDDDEHVEDLDHLDEEVKTKDVAEDDEDGQNKLLTKQESSGSLFSLSISSRKHEAGENEVNSPNPSHCSPNNQDKASSDKKLRYPNENVDCVLNPIENVTQCLNATKVKTLPPVHHLEKENINLDQDCDVLSPEPSFRTMRKLKETHSDLKHVRDEIAVDTSLSNWLVDCETTPKSKSSASSVGNSPMWTRNSAKSYEDRPILGALTLEELRQFSAFSTPRRSRSRSPEDTPIIGTVGSYWSHTGQDADLNPGSSCRGSTKMTRKSREDERVNWNSTPFLERLDMALASNSAEV